MTKAPFPIYDSRNPKYYEKRAGYPLPDAEWYRNSKDETGDHIPMTFSKENFVQGFNLTCGQYYILRDHLVKALRKDDFYKKDFHRDMDAKFDAWNIWDELNKHPLLQNASNAHPKWRHDMLWKWISGTSLWIEKHVEALDNGMTPDKGWEWGPDRITPKNGPNYVQFQHIRIRISDATKVERIIPVIALIEGNMKAKPNSPIDLDTELVRLEHLRNILVNTKNFTLHEDDQIMWTLEGENFEIETDGDLVTALSTLRCQDSDRPDEVVFWLLE
ncbi:hypothetical protein HRS9139_04061 [Pyrenophora teres f. teres]|uniref:Uncharacterized protein n=1 Tax=Pyrenophora teres f. teres TaxID=97479 RepID=A0A6S6VQG6_9PLEO|nr:hypothetical protein HRS9139_04061 [Pyrenophora teres f. teres]CAE6998987.1 hypothetical protein PTTW11_00819 [Pyrenophora teres f. teres]